MPTLTLSDISSDYRAVSAYNANNTAIENAVNSTIHQDGSRAMQADLDMGTAYRIINAADPASAQDVATKAYVDALSGTIAEIGAIAAADPVDGTFIVWDGTQWVAESGATARASLGLAIGTNVQAYNSGLQSIASVSHAATGVLQSNGTTFDLTTTPTFTGFQIGASATIAAFLDEDSMASDSAVAIPSQQSVKAYVDTAVAAADHLADVDTLAGLASVSGAAYPNALVRQVYNTKEIFATPVAVDAMELYWYDAASKEVLNSPEIVASSEGSATVAGRYKRATIQDEGGDTALALPKHLAHAENMGARGYKTLKDSISPVPQVRFMRAEGDNNGSSTSLIGLYSSVVDFQTAAVFDSIGMKDSDQAVFTVPQTCMGQMKAQVSVQCATAGNAFRADIIKTPAPTTISGVSIRGGVTGSPIAMEPTTRLYKASHGLAVGDIIKLGASSINSADVNALNNTFHEVVGVTGTDYFDIELLSAIDSAPVAGQQVITAVSDNGFDTTLTVTGHGYSAGEWVYIADVTDMPAAWYNIFSTPTADTFVILAIVGTGLGASPTAAVLSAAMTVYDYVNTGAMDVLCRNQIDVTETGIAHVITLDSGVRKFTQGEKYFIRLRAPFGSGATLPDSSDTFTPETFLEFQELGYLAPAEQKPNLGRNLAIPQGVIEYMFRSVEDAIDHYKDFSHVCLSGVATIDSSDSGAVRDLTWATDMGWTDGTYTNLMGNNATKYTNQRQLVRGIRAANERAQIWGYVNMAADAPRGTNGGQGVWPDGLIITNTGTTADTGCTIAVDAGKVKVTKTGHSFADNDWVFIATGDGGGATDLENAGFVVKYIDANNYYLMVGTGTAASPLYVDPTGLTVAGTNATIRDYWTVSDVPNVRMWIDAWRKDGVDGIFFDLSADQWTRDDVRELVIREVRKAGLRAMYNITAPTAANASWVFESEYIAPGDYIFFEGAYGSEVNANASLTPSAGSNTISNTEAALAEIDANRHRGLHVAMLFSEEKLSALFTGAAGVSAIEDNAGAVRVTFLSNHPYINGDVVRFNNFRDTDGLWIDALNGRNFTVANGGTTRNSQTTLELSGLDPDTLTTYSQANSTAKFAGIYPYREFGTSGQLWTDFKTLVDARPIEDAAGAMSSDLGTYNLAPPHFETSWGAFEDQ